MKGISFQLSLSLISEQRFYYKLLKMEKYFLAVCIFAMAIINSSADIPEVPLNISSRVFEKSILKVLEGVRLRMCYSNHSGLPQLDPLLTEVYGIRFNIKNENMEFEARFDNPQVRGLSRFIIKDFEMSSNLGFGMLIYFPKLFVTGRTTIYNGFYKDLMMFPSNNAFSLIMEGLTVKIKGRFVASETGMKLRDLHLNVQLSSLNLNLKMFTDDVDTNRRLNYALSLLSQDFINDLPRTFLEQFETTIENLASNTLNNVYIKEFLQFLIGNVNLPPLIPEKACKFNYIEININDYNFHTEI